MFDLLDYEEVINRLLARYGVKFGLYKNGEFIARYLYDKENSDSVYSNPYIQVRQKKSIQNLPRLVWRQFYGLCLFREFCWIPKSQKQKT